MTDGGRAEPEPPEDQGNRNVENAVMLGFFVVLVGNLVARYHGRHTKGSGLRRSRVFRKSGYRFCEQNTRKLRIQHFLAANRIPLCRKML
jgi:hypothetical protein